MRRIPIAAAALLLGTAGVAFAANLVASVVDSDSVIHGCRGKTTGLLRAVAGDAPCFAWEERLSWNRQGPQGEQGEAGSAAAYATVRSDGTLIAERTSDGFAPASIVRSARGPYCVDGLPFAPRSIVATATEPGLVISATLLPLDSTVRQSLVTCKDGADALVLVTDGGVPVEGGFTVWFED